MAAPDFCLKLDTGGLSQPSSLENFGVMDGSRVSDFSIERILSPQLGQKQPVTVFSPELQGLPGVFGLDSGSLGPAPVPVPVPVGLLQYRGMSFGEAFYPCAAGFHHADFTSVYSNSGVYLHFSSQDSAGTQSIYIFCCCKNKASFISVRVNSGHCYKSMLQ